MSFERALLVEYLLSNGPKVQDNVKGFDIDRESRQNLDLSPV